jgi:ribosomal-protein-alanine N-acetyltransferase
MITLREAGKADLDCFYQLDQVCFPAGIAYSLREFRSLLHSSRTFSVVAEEAGVLAGFAIAQSVRACGMRGGQIVTIDVAPAFRRRGIGRLLMEQLEVRLRNAHAQ